MPEPLALGAQLLLPARLHAVGVLDERAELVEPRFRERSVLGELLVPPPRRHQLAPRRARLRAPLQLLVAAEAVEHLELVRGTREPPLLELAGHGDDALDRGGHVLAGGRPPPRVRARAPVAEHPPRDEQGVLVLGPEVGQLLELVRDVELGLDVGLRAGRPDERVVALRPEQEPDRLREDRLPRAGLAGDRIQAGSELEVRLPNEDEVLYAQPAQHGSNRKERVRRGRRCPEPRLVRQGLPGSGAPPTGGARSQDANVSR